MFLAFFGLGAWTDLFPDLPIEVQMVSLVLVGALAGWSFGSWWILGLVLLVPAFGSGRTDHDGIPVWVTLSLFGVPLVLIGLAGGVALRRREVSRQP